MGIHADNAMETLKCMSKLSVGLEILSYGMDALGRFVGNEKLKSFVLLSCLSTSCRHPLCNGHMPSMNQLELL